MTMQKRHTTLNRPVGLQELQLIMTSGMREFPPRLPEQPIFYPVLNAGYARQIAREWNTQSGPGYTGFVTAFDVDAGYLEAHEVRRVGARMHEEYWIPAEALPEFNRHIQGRIRVIESFFGDAYAGPDPRGLEAEYGMKENDHE